MGNLINRFFGEAADQSADQTLAYSLMASAAASAQGYLAATLIATTPELRAILSGFVTQKICEHESLANLVISHNWMNPYEDPQKQLEASYYQSQTILSQHT